MELIGAGFQREIHHCAALADIRSKTVRLHLEFRDCINRRLDYLEPDLLFVVVESVEQKVVVCRG